VLIDWFTVGAQVINFLILVWLLKRFFYRPILHALDAREKRIASDLAAAAEKERLAEAERSRFQQKNEEFDRRRSELMSIAADEARAERKRMLAAARTDADELSRKRSESQRREYEALRHAIKQRTCEEVFSVVRKVLGDLANTTLEAHMAEAFISRMHSLGPEAKASLATAAGISATGGVLRHEIANDTAIVAASSPSPADRRYGSGEITIRSAFELPKAQREAIAAAVGGILGEERTLRFQLEPNLISGIELVVGGYKVAWTIAGYVASLEEEVGRLVGAGDAVESSAVSSPGGMERQPGAAS
jgi:F-type H+-transporting ATPase subunit b